MAPSLHLCLVLSFAAAAMSAKVLLVPTNVNSHVIFVGRLAAGLAEHGHLTTILLASNVKVPAWLKGKVEIVTYNVDEPVPYANSEQCSELMVKTAAAGSFWEKLPLMKEAGEAFGYHWNRDCEQAMDDDQLLTKLNNSKYDLAIMDMSTLYCLYNLPYKLNIPYAHYGVPFSPWVYRVPQLPSFAPSASGDLSDRMTFFQRLENTMMESMTYFFLNESTHYSEKYVPEKPPMTASEFILGGSLFFMLRDLSVGYPAPLMPNTIEVGDIMAQPAKPLPADLAKFMDGANSGVILVSFGSFFDHLPENIAQKFCDAFKVVQHKIIWKMKQKPACQLSQNVEIMEWIPQNDLLAHRNLKIFITHGGINSIIESVFHQVPMIVVPIALDQPYNAAIVHNNKMGVKMQLSSFSTEDLISNINMITNDKEIAANLKLHSAVLREKPDTAAERASFWVNHIVKYGPDHLRSGAMELTVAQFFMLDIFLFIFVVTVVMFLCFVCCLWASCKCFKKCCCKKQVKLKQS